MNGEWMYDTWRAAMLKRDIQCDAWEELDNADREAWDELFSETRDLYP